MAITFHYTDLSSLCMLYYFVSMPFWNYTSIFVVRELGHRQRQPEADPGPYLVSNRAIPNRPIQISSTETHAGLASSRPSRMQSA